MRKRSTVDTELITRKHVMRKGLRFVCQLMRREMASGNLGVHILFRPSLRIHTGLFWCDEFHQGKEKILKNYRVCQVQDTPWKVLAAED